MKEYNLNLLMKMRPQKKKLKKVILLKFYILELKKNNFVNFLPKLNRFKI